VIGVLNVESDQPAAFSPGDERFLITIAGQLATAIEKIRLLQAEYHHMEEMRQAKDQLALRVAERTLELSQANELLQRELAERKRAESRQAIFANLAQSLNAITSARQAAEVIVTAADQLMGWDACAVNLCVPGQDRLYHVLAIDTIDEQRVVVPAGNSSDAPSPTARRVMTEGPQLILRQDAQSSSAFVNFGDKSRPSASLMFVPIRNGPQVAGILTIQSYTPNAYTPEDLATLQALADHASSALNRIQATDELRAQKQLFENLVAFARAAIERPVLEDTLDNVLAVAVALTTAEGGSLFLLNEDGKVTHTAWVHPPLSPTNHRHLVARIMDKGLAGWVVASRLPALLVQTEGDERWQAVVEGSYKAHSALAVPIIGGPALLGVLTLSHSQPAHFNEEHLRLMQAAADQMALAVRNAQIFEAVRRMADRQVTLYDVLRVVGGQLNPQAVASAAVDAISQFAGWPNVGIALPTEDGKNWRAAAANGLLADTVDLVVPIHTGIIGRAFLQDETQYVPNAQADKDYLPGPTLDNTHSELAVPLRRGGRIMGVLNLESEQPDDFNTEDILLAESLAGAVALALDNARLYSEIRASLADLSTLIEASRDGIIFINLEGVVRVVNAAALRLLGLPEQPAGWINRPIVEAASSLRHSHPAVFQMILAELYHYRLDPDHSGEAEYQISSRILHLLNITVRSGYTALGRLLVLRDVTEERMLEKLREDLTHTMVHDLRNPLTAISMSLQMLVSRTAGSLSPDQQRTLNNALNRTHQLAGLVNAILDLSQLESGHLPLRCESLSLAELAADTLYWQAPLAAEKGIFLEQGITEELPHVSADPALVRRVLENLIGNAIKFTPDGGRISLAATGAEKGTLRVTVADSGPGIPADLQARLFQKFVTGRQPGKGSGLGLAFCRLAVEAHGGRIWLENQPAGGAAFHFTLPLVA
jgi:two-component system, NtrC family, sensor histidine kinase KinB